MKLRLRTKLLGSFLFLLLLIGLVGYFGISGMNDSVKNYDIVVHTNIPVYSYVWELRSMQLEQTADVRGYILYHDEKYPQMFADSNKKIIDTYSSLEPLLTTKESKAFLADFKSAHEKYEKIADRVFTFVKQGNAQAALSAAEEGREYVDKNKSITSEWIQWVDQINSQKVDEVNGIVTKKRTQSYAVMLLAILIGLGTGLYLTRSISKPINMLAEISECVAKGDLTQPIPVVNSGDEIENLAKSYGTMIEQLRNLIKQVSHASQQLASTSQEMSATSQQTTASTEQVASTINQLALGASQQASDAENANNIVSKMVSEILAVAENIQGVASTGEKVAQTAQQGSLEAENVISRMEKISDVTNQSGIAIKTLGQESEKVGQIVNVIKDIAEQTNLLALNAAIEAARAGEQGKGFAVVADEVRKLAEKSSNSTQQIAELINNIQKGTVQAIQIMDVGNRDVNEGVQAVSKATEAFKLIAADVALVVKQIHQVQAVFTRMADGSREAAQSIDSIASIAQQTAAFTQEVSATGEEQAVSVQEVAKAAQELAKLADQLNIKLLDFKVN